MVKVSTPAKYKTQYYYQGGNKLSYWPDGAALFSIELFCKGIPWWQHKDHYEKRWPGWDPVNKWKSNNPLNGMINNWLKTNEISDEMETALAIGRTAGKRVPGGSVERIQNHPHTLAWHAHFSSDTITIKNAPEFEDEGPEDLWRRRQIADDWEGNVNGSGKSKELKDHLNELNKANRKAKTKEKKVKTEKLKEKSRRDKI